MAKIIEYAIVTENNPTNLELEVRILINQGYKPQGSSSVVILPENYTDDFKYNQAMVKQEDKP